MVESQVRFTVTWLLIDWPLNALARSSYAVESEQCDRSAGNQHIIHRRIS
jgi:hypothetical protein